MVLSKDNVTIGICSNTAHCEWSIPEPDPVKDRGYYFCSAVITVVDTMTTDNEYYHLDSNLLVHLPAIKQPGSTGLKFKVGLGITSSLLGVIILGIFVACLVKTMGGNNIIFNQNYNNIKP